MLVVGLSFMAFIMLHMCGSYCKESASNAGYLGLIPGLGRTPGEGSGYPLHYSCWRIPWTEKDNSPYGHKETNTTDQLTHAPSMPTFWRVFNHKWVSNCVRSFLCIHWDDHIVFIFQFAYTAYHIDWFVCVEEILYPWDKACLIIMYDLFVCCWICLLEFCWRFLHLCSSVILACNFHFFVASLSGFGSRVMVALWNEFGSFPFSAFFWRSLSRISVRFSLNFW